MVCGDLDPSNRKVPIEGEVGERVRDSGREGSLYKNAQVPPESWYDLRSSSARFLSP